MDNKEIKTTATELNDGALENVSGGLLKPVSDWGSPSPNYSYVCPGCQGYYKMPDNLDSRIANGEYYRDQNGKLYCQRCTDKKKFI